MRRREPAQARTPSLACGRLALVLVAGIAIGTGCAVSSLPTVAPADAAEARRDYAAALRAAESLPLEGGTRALEAFLRAHPRSALADDAGLRLAELQIERSAPIAAASTLQRVVDQHPRGDRTDDARLMLARLYHERGRSHDAYRVASGVRFSTLTARERDEALALLAELAASTGDVEAHLRWLGQAQAEARDEARRTALDREIGRAIEGMDAAALAATAERIGARLPSARLRLREAELLVRSGDSEGAERALERARALPLGPGDAERLARLDRRLAGGGGGRLLELPSVGAGGLGPDLGPISGSIGVVLPLSGAYAGFGEASLQGILLATGHFDRERTTPSGVRVRVLDSGGDAATAAAAVRSLAADPDVSAVIGPLLGAESEAAAAAAQELGVPLLALSRRESIATGRGYVLRLGETPRLDAELMAAYAIETLGLRRFAILYPDMAFGRAQRQTFWDAVEARGGEIVGVARYGPEDTDFSKPIRRMIGYELITAGAAEAIRERDRMRKRAKRLRAEPAATLREAANALTAPDGSPLPPFVDFDALFIPDTHETVGLIAPHLAFHEVNGVRLLGTSPWNAPDLVRLGGRHIDGAVFTAGSFSGSTQPHLAEFDRRFARNFERAPGDLAAAAFDAATLAVVAITRAGRDRERIVPALRAQDRWPGVSGVIGFDANGALWKRPHILGVERGEIVSVDERREPPHLRRARHCDDSGSCERAP